ncbi:hypothetical protein R1sor_027168 [Riccia sorocarpa]|uniref:Uncharacterized protein n=1 Tax=Riccia sorocarpa TaxID=122646 RepID=A0ABD3GDG3_9MARC
MVDNLEVHAWAQRVAMAGELLAKSPQRHKASVSTVIANLQSGPSPRRASLTATIVGSTAGTPISPTGDATVELQSKVDTTQSNVGQRRSQNVTVGQPWWNTTPNPPGMHTSSSKTPQAPANKDPEDATGELPPGPQPATQKTPAEPARKKPARRTRSPNNNLGTTISNSFEALNSILDEELIESIASPRSAGQNPKRILDLNVATVTQNIPTGAERNANGEDNSVPLSPASREVSLAHPDPGNPSTPETTQPLEEDREFPVEFLLIEFYTDRIFIRTKFFIRRTPLELIDS